MSSSVGASSSSNKLSDLLHLFGDECDKTNAPQSSARSSSSPVVLGEVIVIDEEEEEENKPPITHHKERPSNLRRSFSEPPAKCAKISKEKVTEGYTYYEVRTVRVQTNPKYTKWKDSEPFNVQCEAKGKAPVHWSPVLDSDRNDDDVAQAHAASWHVLPSTSTTTKLNNPEQPDEPMQTEEQRDELPDERGNQDDPEPNVAAEKRSAAMPAEDQPGPSNVFKQPAVPNTSSKQSKTAVPKAKVASKLMQIRVPNDLLDLCRDMVLKK